MAAHEPRDSDCGISVTRKHHADQFRTRRWDDWVPQERLRKFTDENKELASNLKKDMDAQRRATTGKPLPASTKKRVYGSDAAGSSARGSEDRSSVAPQPPKGTKRGRTEIEGIDKVRLLSSLPDLVGGVLAVCRPFFDRRRQQSGLLRNSYPNRHDFTSGWSARELRN